MGKREITLRNLPETIDGNRIVLSDSWAEQELAGASSITAIPTEEATA